MIFLRAGLNDFLILLNYLLLLRMFFVIFHSLCILLIYLVDIY